MGDLKGVRLKIERAHEHLTVLDEAVATFSADHTIVGQLDLDASQYVFRVDGEPPPIEWGVILGEFAHNLRSSLDNLLWVLIEARSNRPSRVNQFPIYEDKTVYKRKGKRVVPVPASDEVRRLTDGIWREDRTFIEAAQPYHDGDRASRHPLAVLGYLNNIDKHRFIHAGFVGMTVRRYGDRPIPLYDGAGPFRTYGIPDGTPLPLTGFVVPYSTNANITGWTYWGRGDDRTEIMHVTLKEPPLDAEVKVNPTPAVAVSLSDRERPLLIADLWAAYRRVVEILDRFAGVIGE